MQLTTVLLSLIATVSASLIPQLEVGTILLNQELLNRNDEFPSHDIFLANKRSLAGSLPGITNEQAVTIQNQLIAQRNLEAVAAILAAQAGMPAPAGIQPAAAQAVATIAAEPVVVASRAPVVVAAQAPASIVVATQAPAPVFQVPETAAIIVDTKPHARALKPSVHRLALHTAIAL
ncbi:hypothetical protein FBU59_007307 [Linderina macrospora]|uniref:Uncharacterized protein n=1 Tax=Linderina macrospora TaxID=4868 RepID=A0ACC1IXM8_9FUNG|nr:hypothetical protein FBU59_007307 [Linderina macrospora]